MIKTVTSVKRSTARRVAITALFAAVGLGVGVVPAAASAQGDITEGHIDFVSANVNGAGTNLVLGSNYEDTEWVSAGTHDLVVPQTTAGGVTGYIVPETQSEATLRGVPWAGFSGDEALRDAGFADTDTVTLTLSSVSFTPKPGTSGSGTVTISQGGTAWFTAAQGHAHTFITDGDEEVFHEHAKWVFSAPGTYVLTFTGATTGPVGAAPAASYTVKAGL